MDFIFLPTYKGVEKYKYICNETENDIERNRVEEWIRYYNEYPIEFAENYLGIELKWYQKILLKSITKQYKK